MKYTIIGLKSKCELNFFSSKRNAIAWIDNLLLDVKNFSLLGYLNDIQATCKTVSINGKSVNCFEDKFDMPLIIINLVIKEHGLRIREH